MIDELKLSLVFDQWTRLLEEKDGSPFSSLAESQTFTDQEGYKEPLWYDARSCLEFSKWRRSEIGTGTIRDRLISAVERKKNNQVDNNLVFTSSHSHGENGPISRLRQIDDLKLFESLIFELYRGKQPHGEVFDGLVSILGRQYGLIAYLFFIQDKRKYLPIAPENFDRAFNLLAIPLRTSHQCRWDNYQQFLGVVAEVRSFLSDILLEEVRLLDAHSFLWMIRDFEAPFFGTEKADSGSANCWRFSVTDQGDFEAREIFERRMIDGFWGLTKGTAYSNQLRVGDRVLFYLGSGSRCFCGSARIASKMRALQGAELERLRMDSSDEELSGVSLSDIHIFPRSVAVDTSTSNWQFLYKGAIAILEKEQFLQVCRSGSAVFASVDELSAISEIRPTDKRAVVKIRLGQQRFREQLLRRWNGCAVTDCGLERVLVASHIKPWRDSNDGERVNPDNGLLLEPNLDALFDAYLISFENDGKIIVSTDMTEDEMTSLRISKSMRISKLTEGMIPFLEYHRAKMKEEQEKRVNSDQA